MEFDLKEDDLHTTLDRYKPAHKQRFMWMGSYNATDDNDIKIYIIHVDGNVKFISDNHDKAIDFFNKFASENDSYNIINNNIEMLKQFIKDI